jgi:hypothetical protein
MHGYVEMDKIALKHVALRTKSQDSDYKPNIDDVAPRSNTWKPKGKASGEAAASETHTQ